MRRGTHAAAAVGLVLGISLTLAADDIPDPRSLIESSIEYHGGHSALRNLPDTKALGTSERAGRSGMRTSDIVVYERADGGRRLESTSDFGGRKRTTIEIFNGTVCKRTTGGGWDDLPLDENRERAAHRVPILLDASDRDPQLLGRGSEAAIDVWRVAITDGDDQTVLSLAVDDARLVAIEYPGTEASGMGTKKRVTIKQIHRSFRAVDGVRLPDDTEVQSDGSFDRRIRLQTLEPLERWDERWLQTPDPRRRFIPAEELSN